MVGCMGIVGFCFCNLHIPLTLLVSDPALSPVPNPYAINSHMKQALPLGESLTDTRQTDASHERS